MELIEKTLKENRPRYSLSYLTFGQITNLLMILEDVSADINGDCYDDRMKFIRTLKKVYEVPEVEE